MSQHFLSLRGFIMLGLVGLMGLLAACQPKTTPRHRLLDAQRIVFMCQHARSQAEIPPELPANLDAIAVMAPMWYDVRDDGEVARIDPKGDFAPYLELTRQRGVAVMPILRNFKPHAFLLNPQAIDRAVSEITAMLESGRYDGLTIDLEEDGSDLRLKAPMLDFVERVYRETQRRGQLLCVTFNPVYWGRSWQNEEILSRCDWAFAMFYDYSGPWNRKTFNATAPYEWPSRSRDLKRDVARIMTPEHAPKILFGIPTYGNRVTLNAKGECVEFTVAYVNRLLAEKERVQAPRQWDAVARTPRFEYTDEPKGVRNIVWYEDEVSYRWRMALAADVRAAGVGVWSIGANGGIDEAVWPVLRDYQAGKLPSFEAVEMH